MTQQSQAPLVAEALQWVSESLDKWIADCEADPSGFALWAVQRLRSCRTQIVGLARQLEQAVREKERIQRQYAELTNLIEKRERDND